MKKIQVLFNHDFRIFKPSVIVNVIF